MFKKTHRKALSNSEDSFFCHSKKLSADIMIIIPSTQGPIRPWLESVALRAGKREERRRQRAGSFRLFCFVFLLSFRNRSARALHNSSSSLHFHICIFIYITLIKTKLIQEWSLNLSWIKSCKL